MSGGHPRLLPAALALATAIGIVALAPARAQDSSSPAACPAGNLLANKRPARWQDVRGDVGLVTDSTITPEGAIWNAPLAVVLDTGASTLTYDLQATVSVQAVYAQADANDTYHVWGSADGSAFRLLGRIEPVADHGLRGRTLSVDGAPVRYLRFGEGVGDNFYSLSELQAFCQVPTPFPPKMNVKEAPAASAPKTIFTYWNNETSSRWELVLAVLGIVFLGWELTLRQQGRAAAHKRLRNGLLAAMGVVSFFTYFNFGFAHFGNLVHDWEWTHYYVGSKYFNELGYDKLYECIAIADVEESEGLRRRVELRKLTNLRTNALETTADILAHPERCKQSFSGARWDSFKRDIRFFRDRQSARRWDDLQTDHGYNGTPVWNIAGSVLANLASASKGQLFALAILDPLYLVAMAGVIWWAFGWRVTCVGLLVFATNFPSRFYWTGGAFLRWDWLFYTVAAVCCLRKDRPLLAGLALGYATLLRVFPGFVFVGPLLAAGVQLVRTRRFGGVDRRYVSLFLGAALAVIVLVPVSLQTGGGIDAYRRFVQNTVKHKETPLTNYMGLRTVVAYRPSEAGRLLRNDSYTDPWSKWKSARLRGFQEAKPFYVVLVAAYLVLLGFAVRGRDPWIASALGSTFIAVGVELTCYYYAFIIVVALLYEHDQRIGRVLLFLTAFTGFVDWRPHHRLPGWLDEQYTLMSAATLVAFVVILWEFGLGRVLAARRASASAVAAAATGESAPAPASAVAEVLSAHPAGNKTKLRKRKRRR